jgi:hypothetical protein
MSEQYLLELARKWIVANAPEPSKCVKCGQPQPSTMCTADLRCPIDYESHVYTFTITNDPDAEAKRLAAFGQAALSTQPHRLGEEAVRRLRIIADLPISERGEDIPSMAATLKQIALDYFEDSVDYAVVRTARAAPPVKLIPGVAGEYPCGKCGEGIDGAFDSVLENNGKWFHRDCWMGRKVAAPPAKPQEGK